VQLHETVELVAVDGPVAITIGLAHHGLNGVVGELQSELLRRSLQLANVDASASVRVDVAEDRIRLCTQILAGDSTAILGTQQAHQARLGRVLLRLGRDALLDR